MRIFLSTSPRGEQHPAFGLNARQRMADFASLAAGGLRQACRRLATVIWNSSRASMGSLPPLESLHFLRKKEGARLQALPSAAEPAGAPLNSFSVRERVQGNGFGHPDSKRTVARMRRHRSRGKRRSGTTQDRIGRPESAPHQRPGGAPCGPERLLRAAGANRSGSPRRIPIRGAARPSGLWFFTMSRRPCRAFIMRSVGCNDKLAVGTARRPGAEPWRGCPRVRPRVRQ